ncbi:ATP-binding protein [Salinispirillum sp. LH 10-3-1]|uniref:histidine kinase n=1 Tax=Salinispirillum sp. LH 10-3-1 TaxID=2952525 RepID=A0AB38YFB3_9GAMM
MIFSIPLLLGSGLAYLAVLMLAGYAADRGWLPQRWSENPFVYTLALSLYFSAWVFFGLLALAYTFQTGYLTLIAGLLLLFVAAPVLVRPVLRIAQSYQLSSLADMMAFRFRSRWAGSWVTLALTLTALPMLALQIRVLNDSVRMLVPGTSPVHIAFGFCTIALFLTLLLSARQRTPTQRHHSLVIGLAADGVVKLLAFIVLGGFVTWQVFAGPGDMWAWKSTEAQRYLRFNPRLGLAPGLTMVAMFFIAPIVFPQMFHVLVREHPDRSEPRWLQWGLPVYALLFAIPVFPILWGGIKLGFPTAPELFVLSIGEHMSTPLLSLLLFIVIASAALTTTVVTSLALASMWVNHGVLPYFPPRRESSDIYRWLMWTRRAVIVTLLTVSLLVALNLHENHSLSHLGLITFAATLQFLPGLIGLLYWPGASRSGFVGGLVAGMTCWLLLLGLPLLLEPGLFAPYLPTSIGALTNEWFTTSLLAMLINLVCFVGLSIRFPPTRQELAAASACSQNAPLSPSRRGLRAHNAREFVHQLARPLGQVTAEREVDRALNELGYTSAEYRPFALRRLRDRLEVNLSGLMGPSVAQALVERYLAVDSNEIDPATEDLYLVENRLEGLHTQLTGMARELDQLRRFHRDTLMRLPIGVFSLAADGEILMWNRVMEQLVGLTAEQVLGTRLNALPPAWRDLLMGFVNDESTEAAMLPLDAEEGRRWLGLHRSPGPDLQGGAESAALVVLVDDQTQTKLLEDELIHSERLAAIGSLSAGVAHEIGNPITGIDSLAQELKYLSEDPNVQEVAVQIREQTQRVTNIVQSLVSYAHAGQSKRQGDHSPHVLYDIVQDAVNLLQLSKDRKPVVLLNEVPPDLYVLCDAQRLGQVFINLLTNARDASQPRDEITITALADTHRIQIEVVDRGVGIPKEVKDRILEPFFTTKDVGKGTGLGLPLANNIVEEHFGSLEFESPAFRLEGRGTRVIITLPRHSIDTDTPE